MVESLLAGIIFTFILLLVACVLGWYYKFELWTVFVGVTIISFGFFFIPNQNYTWLEWGFDNAAAWSIFLIISTGVFIHSKFTPSQ